jgi:hypothetical protein
MKYTVWMLVFALLVLHQDYWQWDNATLDLGFLPRAVSYHIIISLAAAMLWLLATIVAWPLEADDVDDQTKRGES